MCVIVVSPPDLDHHRYFDSGAEPFHRQALAGVLLDDSQALQELLTVGHALNTKSYAHAWFGFVRCRGLRSNTGAGDTTMRLLSRHLQSVFFTKSDSLHAVFPDSRRPLSQILDGPKNAGQVSCRFMIDHFS